MTKSVRVLLTCVALTLVASIASAQGVQTGTLTGTVRDQGNLPLPGAAVTVTSTALQGARTAATDANGVYALAGLPPGIYAVRFELQGMRTAEATQRVDLGTHGPGGCHACRWPSRRAFRSPPPRRPRSSPPRKAAPTCASTTSPSWPPSAPCGASPNWHPALTDNTPNANQLTIAGGFAYDNQFLINGVDVADNIFGTPNNLFIEDALQEVQVLTSGISAEFGRFGGGVVNAITKSGGNTFSGSTRLNFYSPSWTKETPFETSSNVVRPEGRAAELRVDLRRPDRQGSASGSSPRAAGRRPPRRRRCRRRASPSPPRPRTSAASSSSPPRCRRTTRCRAAT